MATDQQRSVFRGFQRSTGVGALPGTITGSPVRSAPCRITVLKYNASVCQEISVPSPSELSLEADPEIVTWVSIEGIADAELLMRLGELYCLHDLALEDVVNSHQRCKVEDYDEYVFIIGRIPVFRNNHGLSTDQVSIFLGRRFVISIHHTAKLFEPIRERILKSKGRIRERGADFLAYALVDTVTDNYFPVIEQIGNRLNAIDESLERGGGHPIRQSIHNVRTDLLLLRKTVWPQRDAIAHLMRDDCELMRDETRTYLRDCYDHTIQLMDVTETYRELCADLRDYYLADISFRSNEIMKTLTIISTVFLPLTFFVGWYGMNFESMPEIKWPYGYAAAIVFMVACTAGMLWWFRRRRWL